MADENGSTGKTERSDDEAPGRIWRSLRSLFRGDSDHSLRAQLEEAIDEHERDPESDNALDLSPLERDMLRNMLHFSETTVDDIAVPRSDIIAIEERASFREIVELFAEHGHSRIPVYRENLDDIIGMIHIKDMFALLASGGEQTFVMDDLLRQPRFAPESMGLLEMLAEMRATRTHLAIILDEYGGTEGLLTIEDIVEEIVGEIEDEHDDEPVALITALPDGLWEVDARAELSDIAHEISEKLSEIDEDVDTVGGMAVVLAGHIPEVGEMLEHPSGWRLEIIAADDRRVTRIRLHPPEERPDPLDD
ncbi:MAG: hemolysin family protein [Parasphingorhabdus sp.]|nr:hemolysin family protein [Parasphingorhabdus sp.]